MRMAYAMGKVQLLIGIKVDDDNEELGLIQGNYILCPHDNDLNMHIIDRKGNKIKVDICEFVDEPVLDEYVD